jgi:hypothetical protein
MQVREGEIWNPTPAPTLAGGGERGEPATDKQYSKLTMKKIVMLIIIVIIVLFRLISLVDYYSSSAPLFPTFLLLFKNTFKRSVYSSEAHNFSEAAQHWHSRLR